MTTAQARDRPRLLDLPEEVRDALQDGTLSEGHGRAIMLASSDGARRAVFRSILRDKLSVREAERLARVSEEAGDEGRHKKVQQQSAELQSIEQRLQTRLGTRVHIHARARGGRIVLDYFSPEQFDHLIEVLSRA